jgi:two-component system, LuxR family, response regulator FixJ
LSSDQIIAIVDDEPAVRASLGTLMRSIDVRAELFASADAFLAGDPSRFGGILSDIQMPGRSGIDLLRAVRQSFSQTPVVLMTAFPDERVGEQARAGGAYRFLTKPCDPDMIVGLVEQILSPR